MIDPDTVADEYGIPRSYFRGYLGALLFSELALGSEDEDQDFESLGYTADDIPAATLRELAEDAADFYEEATPHLGGPLDDLARDLGVDFAFTRNGHGVGFWDGGWGEIGDKLTELAEPYGDVTLYLGDDDEICAA